MTTYHPFLVRSEWLGRLVCVSMVSWRTLDRQRQTAAPFPSVANGMHVKNYRYG
jgi:hypothetical protein